jgi:drug/metabolite transporter (DMT)-like permease
MLYILISILSLSGIFVVFKIAEKKKLSVINIIVVNYLFAAVIGNIQSGVNALNMFSQDWFLMAFIIGVLFFVSFVIIGISTKLVGLSITTVAAKMSTVIPIIFSIIYFSENIGVIKILGVLMAVIGVVLTVYKPTDGVEKKINIYEILVPLILFVGMGTSDSLMKYSQYNFLNSSNIALFNSSLFYISFISSLIYVIFTKQIKELFSKNIWGLGIVLGILNFYGVFFFIKALESEIFDSSIIFGINNVGIVSLSVLIGMFVFKEKLFNINKIGVAVSILAIIILSQA